MTALVEAGYVAVTKSGKGRGGVTTFRITRAGGKAYTKHRAALRALLAEG